MIYDNCPICDSKLDKSHLNKEVLPESIYLECKHQDHSFFVSFMGKDIRLMKIKFISEDKKKTFLKLDFRDQIGHIWTQPNDPKPKRIPLFEPDFSNIPRFKQKLKTFLIFV
jgi:hypothetical protein